MAVVGSIRVMNITPFARTQVVVTNMPLPQGLVTDSNGARLTARSAYLGVDVPVQIMRPALLADGSVGGAEWPDGSWRIARVAFPVSMDAGTSPGSYGYEYHSERNIEIETGGADLPAFSVHPDLDLAQMGFRWLCRIYDPDTQSRGDTPWRAVDFTPTTGSITDYVSPYTATTPAAAEEWDTAQIDTLRGWVHAYTVSGRIMPEADGGTDAEPSTYASVSYEIPNGAIDGCGRILRAWLECGNALFTEDDRPRNFRGGMHGILDGDPAFLVRNLDGNHRWHAQVDQSGLFTTAQDNTADRARITVLRPYAVSNRNSHHLPMGYCRALRFQLMGSGADASSLTAMDSSTWAAIQHGNGMQAFPDAMATTWHDHQDSYGPYGVALRWDQIGFDTEDAMRSVVARKTRAELEDYKGEDAYPRFPKHGNLMATSGSSNHNNFSAFGCQSYVASSHPDLRTVWLSMTTDAHRGQTWRDLNCKPISFRHDFANTGLPSVMWSGHMMFDGITWRKTALDPLPYYTKVGKAQGVEVNKRTQTPGGLAVNSRGQRDTGYTYIDYQHVDFGHPYAFAALTGDRWMVGRRVRDMINHSFCHKPQSLTETGDWSPVPTSGGGNSMHGTGVTRSEGRIQRCRAQAAWWTWDDELFTVMANRAAQYRRFNTNGNPNGNYQGTLEKTVAVVSLESGYFPRYYSCTNIGQPLWDSGASVTDQAFSNFQHAMIAEGFYLTWRMLNLHGGFAAEEADADYIFRRLCRGHLLGAWRNMPNGDRRTFYAWDVTGQGYEPIPVQYHGPGRQLCSEGGSVQRSDEWGPAQPTRAPIAGGEGMPMWRFPASDFNPYCVPPAMLAGYYITDDSEVESKVRDILVEHRTFPTQDELRDNWVCNYDGGYLELCCTVPDPFRRWDNYTGSRTFDETAAADLETGSTGASDAVTVLETGAADLELGSAASDYRRFDETAAADLDLDSAATDILQAVTVGVLVEETAVADLDTGAALAAATPVFQETAAADLDFTPPTFESIERSDVTPDELVTTDDDGNLTIDEAIGPARIRSRRVRLYRDSRGEPARVTQPGPWRGPEPTKRTFHPDARIDDA